MLTVEVADLQAQHFEQHRLKDCNILQSEYKAIVQKYPEAAALLNQAYKVTRNILRLAGCILVREQACGSGER
jgi:hypothetical protein